MVFGATTRPLLGDIDQLYQVLMPVYDFLLLKHICYQIQFRIISRTLLVFNELTAIKYLFTQQFICSSIRASVLFNLPILLLVIGSRGW